MNHVMIDIETVGRLPHGGVIALGAAAFRMKDRCCFDTFEVLFSLDDVIRLGGEMEADTMEWWAEQDAAVRDRMFSGTTGLREGLRSFNRWFNGVSPERTWARGTTFDITLMEAAYKDAGVGIPWMYWQTRDSRLFDDVKMPFELHAQIEFVNKQGVLHDAKSDAVNQAKVVQIAGDHIGLS